MYLHLHPYMHNSICGVIFQRRTELAARRAKFDELFERREEETESKTYDLSQHLVTVTEVAEVDLADEGTHLGRNQVREIPMFKPTITQQVRHRPELSKAYTEYSFVTPSLPVSLHPCLPASIPPKRVLWKC